LDRLTENTGCYAKEEQRRILFRLFKHETIAGNFFLTGGTALSVFYLHHRYSKDIDLFSIIQPQFDRVEAWVKNEWPKGFTTLVKEPYILSVYLNEIKVDFVHDSLSFNDKKVKYQPDNDSFIFIDTLRNIASNKFCTLISRNEPKDFIDFYFINKMKLLDIDSIYKDARQKEGMFDDPPMVSYQVENNLKLIKQNPYALPDMIADFDIDEFYGFYEDLIYKTYHKKEE
jgi:predicted nucleotidyltransferase component of viral defense system